MAGYYLSDKDKHRMHAADFQAARKIYGSIDKERNAIRKEILGETRRDISDAEKRFAAEEKELLSKPVRRFTGGTRKMEKDIIVRDWRTVLPANRAADKNFGPLFSLRRGGGIGAEDVLVVRIARRYPTIGADQEWMKRARAATRDARKRYEFIAKLRDDKFMATFFSDVGVTVESKTKETTRGEYGSYSREVTTVTVPTLIAARVERTGLVLVYKHMAGRSVSDWQKAQDKLRAAFKAHGLNASNLEITETASGDTQLSFKDVDAFKDAGIPPAVFDTEKWRSRIGITADGGDAWITWAGNSGMVIGGVPGSGKTASMLPVFASMAGKAAFYVFDGKSGFDLEPLKHIAAVYDRSGDLEAPLETLRMLDELRVLRGEALYQKLQAPNFWNISKANREKYGLTPVFVILDEVQTWLNTEGLDKDEKAVGTEIRRLVRTLIQQARSVGIVAVLTTQKPDAQNLPTVIRDNAALKIAFRVSTPEQGVTVLGKQGDDAPSPTKIPMSAKGRGIMETEDEGLRVFQAGYLSPAAAEALLKDQRPVPDQMAVARWMLGKGPRPTASGPVVDAPAQQAEAAPAQPEPAQPEPEQPTEPSSNANGDNTFEF